LSNILGVPLRAFDDRGHTFRMRYDTLWRPTHAFVQTNAAPEQLTTRTIYGESLPTPEDENLRGQVYRQYDSAGTTTNVGFDFKGGLVRGGRRLATDYTSTPDWIALAELTDPAAIDTAAAVDLDAEVFATEATWDALGRPTTQTSADSTITHLGYNDAGLLETVDAGVRGQQPTTSFVTAIDYDVRGRRSTITYGNGTTTAYTYDDVTLRLRRLHTTRTSDSASVQDLRYTHDPIGNIVETDDLAQQTVFFANAEVSPRQRFEYDATYHLMIAEGREHTSQGQPLSSELTPGVLPDTNDPAALRTWIETYLHDEVGNLTQVQHTAAGGDWTRQYQYSAAGNHLLATSAPGDAIGGPFTHQYVYDAHGNMSAMPHLATIDWDHADRMQHADLGGGGDVWFVYDSAGNRVRKVRVNQSGSQTEERIYLGGVELYRERQNGTLQRERETLHIVDDTGRISLVETLTVDAGTPVVAPANHHRYQYSNHLGSASLELDEAANTISYEEYHPYGTSSYRSVDSTLEGSPKRYRYTGKERDEETGLDHMGARYYAPWLGRWTSADPIGLGDGPNRFAYVGGRPTAFRDPSGTVGETTIVDFSDEPISVKGGTPTGYGLGAVPPEQLSTEGDPDFESFSLAVDRPPIAQQQARRDAELLRGQIQVGKARPPGLSADSVPIEQGGIVVGFVGDKPGDGGDTRQVHSIAGETVGEFSQGAEQDFTLELAVIDLLAAKGLLGIGRAAFAAALERRAAQQAIRRESRRMAAEGAASFAEGSTPTTFADALVQAETRVATSRANAGSPADLEASAASGGGNPANRALHEKQKDALRTAMERPHAEDSGLSGILDNLYRPGAKVGSGSTADAVRHELATGQRVGGRLHSQKASENITRLQKWLQKNPIAVTRNLQEIWA